MSLAIEQFPRSQATVQSEHPRFSIIIPAYNERARLGKTLEQIVSHVRRQVWNAEVVIVDDGSRDETFKIAGQFAAEHPYIRVVQNPGNQGKGYSVRNGMLKARGEILLFTDADLSSPIAEATKLFAAIEQGADVAIGSRWLDPALQFQRQPLKRRIMSRTFNLYLRALLAFPYRDTQCGFKAFTRNAVQTIFPRQRITRWGFDAEILYLAHSFGLKVAEVPVSWGHDERSTIHPWRDGILMGRDALRIRWYALTRRYKSLAAQTGCDPAK